MANNSFDLKAYDILPEDEDLHLFIPNHKNLTESIVHFAKTFSLRMWTNKETWLLDITAYSSIEKVKNILDDNINNLDIDDDLYLFSFDEKSLSVMIWEYYRKHFARPTSMVYLGTWKKSHDLKTIHSEKWKRRGDLEVNYLLNLKSI